MVIFNFAVQGVMTGKEIHCQLFHHRFSYLRKLGCNEGPGNCGTRDVHDQLLEAMFGGNDLYLGQVLEMKCI